MRKYKNVEEYLKKEHGIYKIMGIPFISKKKMSLENLVELKNELKTKNINELKALKSDAYGLGEWFKMLGYAISILIVIFTMFTGLMTNTNQNLFNINNGIIDRVAELKIKNIEDSSADNPILMEELAMSVINTMAKIKSKDISGKYYDDALIFAFTACILAGVLILVIGSSRKWFTIISVINETIEEKKEDIEKEKFNKEIEDGNREKIRIQIEVIRKERLKKKYKSN